MFLAVLALLNSLFKLFVFLCFQLSCFAEELFCLFFYLCFFVSLPEHGGEHEGEHDDGQAKGEHEGQEDPVVGRRGVEDDEVDQDTDDQ